MSWQASGFRAWLLQRLTAVYIGLFLVIVSTWLIIQTGSLDYSQWLSLFTRPMVNVAVLLFFYAVFFHAWVGMRDIIIDYVALGSLRLLLLVIVAVALFVMALWVSLILLSVVHL
ncbi:MAG: succinate dehydrogenase, hydrophobic membrane anchor protein [Thioalkalispiraceae bacterium]|jgi:succinate dehydrogenase / fumarate reductase membrane anchor subunit